MKPSFSEEMKRESSPKRLASPPIILAEMRELQRMAERVCILILCSDYPEIDVEIEKSKVRERCEELFPDRMYLYEMIYESRFNRLWKQFRQVDEDEYEYDW